MSDQQDSSPKWVEKSIETLKKAKKDIDTIRDEGQKEIKRGMEKVQIANTLDGEVTYIYQILNRPQSPEIWTDEIVQATGVLLADTINSLGEETSKLSDYAIEMGSAGTQRNQQFIRAVQSSDAPSASGVLLGASLEIRFQALDPNLTSEVTVLPERISSRDQIFEELKRYLEEYDPIFTAMLHGSEEALHADTTDHLSQAAHSMRDLFQQLIELLAPNQVVSSQPWFTPTDNAPGGVSRRSRLRYILYGSGENIDNNLINQYDRSAHTAKESLDLCMARAHDHDQTLSDLEVQYAIDQARHSLCNVLRSRHTLTK